MARKRYDYLSGTTTAAISDADTTLTSAALADLPAVAAPDYVAVVLHDGTTHEIVHVTAHTAAATTATVTRGAEGSTASAWASGTDWLHGPTAADIPADSDSAPAAPVDGQLWVDAGADATLTLDDLTDVSTTGAAAGQVLGTEDGTTWIPVTPSGGGGGTFVVEDEGAEVVAAASRLNFTGTGVAVTDAGSGEATVTISGGGGTGDVWQAYTPTLTASTTNPTLGTGSVAVGRYATNGKTVKGWAFIKFGTSGVAAGSGTYFVSLPVAQRTADAGNPPYHRALGSVEVNDSSAGVYIGVAITPTSNATAVALAITDPTTRATMSNAAPFTPAASDHIAVEFTYETD